MSNPVEVFSGYLTSNGKLIRVDFSAPKGASKAEKDSAFLDALSEQVQLDYFAIGTLRQEAA